MSGKARYDDIADWYEHELMGSPLDDVARDTLLRLLGDGPGRLLDVGCDTGVYTAAMSQRGWTVTGIDESEGMLRFARERGVDVVRGNAEALPFENESFDVVVSPWTDTDVDDFAAVVREAARVLRLRGPFVYAGAHPCFVGPHARFIAGEGVRELHPGYLRAGRYTDAPGIAPDGLRARVRATHLPLGLFLQTFLGAGFRIEHLEESSTGEYPYMVALRCRR